MKIQEFIQHQILSRLRQHEVLVVYDPDGRYRDLCLALAGEKIQVVDASESSLEARRQALAAFQALGQPHSGLEGLLVYVPAPAPLSDEEKQRDPFALYGACGAVFPDPTNDGDEYLSLCLKAKPDHATEIRRVFSQDPNPS
ncbi:PglZ domain-containing protein, partial [Candidatus Parcubacteria bacterium]